MMNDGKKGRNIAFTKDALVLVILNKHVVDKKKCYLDGYAAMHNGILYGKTRQLTQGQEQY